MINAAANNRPVNILPVPPAHGQLEVPLSIRILIAPIEPTVRWIWSVVVLRAQEDGLALVFLFSSALGLFPFWITVSLAVSGVVLISLSISKAQSKSNRLEVANRELQAEKTDLEGQNHLLVNQKGELKLRYDDTLREKNDLTEERDRLIVERREVIGNRAQVNIERDRLIDEVQRLKQQGVADKTQNHNLLQQRDAAEAAKKRLEEQCRNILGELGELRAQIGLVDDYRNLHENLERFHDLYQQVVGGQDNQKGLLQFAQEKLIPEYKAHRVRLHEMLKTSIALLADDDLNRIPLNGILRLSEEEMGHVERISQAIHLLRELREPIARQLQQNVFKLAGEI